jgi:transcriptional regulator with XRE-family HTH domain
MDLGLADARRLAASLVAEIRDARMTAGISQATAARAAGCSASRWGRIERGEVPHRTW